MRHSELQAKLMAYLLEKRNATVMDGLNPVSSGVDVTYEFGRRVGAKQGMDLIIGYATAFFRDLEQKDEKL